MLFSYLHTKIVKMKLWTAKVRMKKWLTIKSQYQSEVGEYKFSLKRILPAILMFSWAAASSSAPGTNFLFVTLFLVLFGLEVTFDITEFSSAIFFFFRCPFFACYLLGLDQYNMTFCLKILSGSWKIWDFQ